jgi:predicted  nucleic acid-binding Zn-ribbon protein
MNLFQLLWAPARMMLDNFFKLLSVKKNPEIVKRFADAEERTGRNNRANLSNIPVFGLSDDTKKALAGFNGELGRTFKILRDTLTGDAGLFDREYAAALEKLGITIGGMGDGLKKAIEEKLSLIGKDTGKANDNFSGSNNFIKGILGSINTNITQKIRDKIDSVNRQYDLSNDKIIKLVEQLKNAGSTDEINNLFNAIKDEIKNIDELTKTLKSLENEVIKERLSIARENTGAATKGFTDSNSLINGILGSATGGAIDKIRDRMNSLNRQFEITTGKIDKLSEQLKSAATVEEINSLFSAINSEIQAINNLTGSMDGLKDKAERAKNAFDLVQGSLQAIGELGQVIQAAMSSNWIGLIIMAITKLADTFSKISSNAAAAQNILSVLFDVILETISELQPYLDMLFKPLLDIVTALGRIIGVVLNLLVPVIGLLTSMSEAFNILTPILNIGALFLAGLTDAFGALWNVIAEVIRKITFGIVRLGRMQTDNYQKMVDSINAEQNYDSYQNNSTSYTVQGDFYINIYYNHSYVNGDAREIAVNLRNEIRAAEMAGY